VFWDKNSGSVLLPLFDWIPRLSLPIFPKTGS
jgi:hypothetical protein